MVDGPDRLTATGGVSGNRRSATARRPLLLSGSARRTYYNGNYFSDAVPDQLNRF